MTSFVVNSGQTSSGLTLSAGESGTVLDGGRTVQITVISGGTEVVSSGGTAVSTRISSGGAQLLNGFASATIVNDGGDVVVSPGGTEVSATVSGGGNEFFSSGSTAIDAVVDGGTISVEFGAVASATQLRNGILGVEGLAIGTVISGGEEAVNLGAVASGSILSGGLQDVEGTAVSTTINFGFQRIFGGVASAAIVTGGRQQITGFGGTTIDTVLTAGGAELVDGGGLASATTVLSGGTEIVSSGTASDTTISSGGSLIVSSGGSALAATAMSGGVVVYAGGRLIGVTIQSGGSEIVEAGATLSGAVVSGGVTLIDSGTAVSARLSATGYEIVASGGSSIATSVGSAGRNYVLSGGIASGMVVSSGGAARITGQLLSAVVQGGAVGVSAGGFAQATRISGGTLFVGAGGTSDDSRVRSGAREIVSGGTALGTRVSGGKQIVSSGGFASATQVVSGGRAYVYEGGLASAMAISAHAAAYIVGSAVSAVISGGGMNLVSSGTAEDTTVNAGNVVVSEEGLARNTTVAGGGRQIVSAFGVASGTIVSGGGKEFIASGGTASGTTLRRPVIRLRAPTFGNGRGIGTFRRLTVFTRSPPFTIYRPLSMGSKMGGHVARKIGKLTALTISRAKDRGYLSDGGGLYLQVGPAGTKSWVFRFRDFGRLREMGLGAAHTLSLSEAREQATECRKLRLRSTDPIQARREQRVEAKLAAARAMSFRQCAEACIAAHKAGWRNARHAAQWPSTLASYAYPILGDLPIQAIDVGLVMKVLEPIWTTKTETASRLRGRIEAVLSWATARGYRQGDNPARWRGHLDKLLAKQSKLARVKHHAALPYAEVGTLMAKLRDQEGVSALALEFLILTAARTGEVLGATWDEIDLDAAVWTVPATRIKAGREHRIPLSAPALAILQRLHSTRRGPSVFAGARAGRPLSSKALIMVLARLGRGDLTAHGFRSTFRMWAAEQTNFPREVAEQALAHSLPDKVEAAYQRSDLFEKRRKFMDEWARYCARSVTAGEVVPIRGVTG